MCDPLIQLLDDNPRCVAKDSCDISTHAWFMTQALPDKLYECDLIATLTGTSLLDQNFMLVENDVAYKIYDLITSCATTW